MRLGAAVSAMVAVVSAVGAAAAPAAAQDAEGGLDAALVSIAYLP